MEAKIQNLWAWCGEHTPADKGILVPVSGGSDSSLAFWLYASLFPKRTVGVHFGENLRCNDWFQDKGTIRMLPQSSQPSNKEVARWAELLNLALTEDRVLIGTHNRTEKVLGTYSTASRSAFHQPLAGLWKGEVLELCKYIGVPEEILVSSKEADPECGRPVEMAKISFVTVDEFCKEKIGGGRARELTSMQRSYLESLYTRNRFKSELPIMGPLFVE